MKYTKQDWNMLHGASLEATGYDLCRRDLKSMYNSLPDKLKNFAKEHGMTSDGFYNMVIIYLKTNKVRYHVFFTGVASTPHSVGVRCMTTGIIICEVTTSRPSGKDTRELYEKERKKLETHYAPILNG